MVLLNGSGPGHVDSLALLYILWMGMREIADTVSVDRVKVTLVNDQYCKSGQQSLHSSIANTGPYSK